MVGSTVRKVLVGVIIAQAFWVGNLIRASSDAKLLARADKIAKAARHSWLWKEKYSGATAGAQQTDASSGGAPLIIALNDKVLNEMALNKNKPPQQSRCVRAGRFAWDLTKSIVTFPYWFPRDCFKSCYGCCKSCGNSCYKAFKPIPVP